VIRVICGEVDKAYIAGCLDCDGCIQITRRKRRGTGVQYNLDTTISNTSITLMDYLKQMIPQAGWYEDNRGKTKNTCYSFCLTGKGAYKLLIDILPYIKAKKKQAALGIAFAEIKGFNQGVPIPESTNKTLQILYEAMRELKVSEPKGGVVS